MMKWIMLSLLLFILIASFGLWYLQDPGNITITWLGYEVQFSIVTGFILFLLMYCLLSLFLCLISHMHGFVSHVLSYFRRPKDTKEKNDPLHDH